MDLIRFSIQYPIRVIVGVLLILMFGMIEFYRIPIQLTPDIDKPSITVTTTWFGASPAEIEREIIDRQEEYLKEIEGLKKMTSKSERNVGSVVLEFPVGTDINVAMIKVSGRLDQVKGYPDLADKPVVTNVDRRTGAIAWVILNRLKHQAKDINSFRDLCEDTIKPAFERVKGVATSNIFGGSEQEVHVIVDPHALVKRGLHFDQVARALNRENQNISAGDFDEGKRKYLIRTLGEFKNPEEIEKIVIDERDGEVTRLRDVGRVVLGWKEADFSVRQFGEPSIAINCQRANGANVLEVMEELRATIARLNEGVLKDEGVQLTQVYDETVYINSAIDLVQQNLMLGSGLAVVILLFFLRSFSNLLIITVAIPISVVGTFLAMSWMGRNINVISLAGLSFAVGMVVDNSIVVLENIFRHRQSGKDNKEAANDGAQEVWGAVLASTLTTMAVFIPILFMEEEVGQIFRDIALAISASVALSLLVSITVIPSMSSRLKKGKRFDDQAVQKGLIASLSGMISNFIYWICGSVTLRMLVVLILSVTAITFSILLFPSAEYLPTGNRNLVFGILLPPPGYNLDQLTEIGESIEKKLSPHFEKYEGKDQPDFKKPGIRNFFFVAQGQNVFMGAIGSDEQQVKNLIPLMQKPLYEVPGMISFVVQMGLFNRETGKSRTIDIDLTGPDLEKLMGVARMVFFKVLQTLPDAQSRPIPGLSLGNPEIHVIPNRELAARMGMNLETIGTSVDVIMDGRKVSDYKHRGREIDMILKIDEDLLSGAQDIANIPFMNHEGREMTLSTIADVRFATGPDQILHTERDRVVTISVQPAEDMPLEQAMDIIESKIISPLEEQKIIAGDYKARMTGTADDLKRTAEALKWNFLLAVVITYLLMAALFESFVYPVVVMLSVPLASVGGLAGLLCVNYFITFQPMDILTMLGFVILVGTVVNNAILIVHQALNLMRYSGMSHRDAIRESVRTRIRPILMSTLTSVFGMLPLVLFPGAGSELYRGLGSVVVGGLAVSTIFTVFLIPPFFSLFLSLQEALGFKVVDSNS